MCAYVQAPIEVQVKGELDTSSAVFLGKVVGYEFRKGLGTELFGSSLTAEEAADREVKLVRFKVDRWWKTPLPAEVLLITGEWRMPAKEGNLLPSSVGRSMCQLPLIEGESYLIYASGPADKLRYRTCSRTATLTKAADDLKVLGKGTRPRK
jgi:hypothetical protein